MRGWLILILVGILISLGCVSAFQGGDGTAGNPYQIGNWSDLNATRNNLTASYILVANLSSAMADYAGIGSAFEPIGLIIASPFYGVFDGNYNTISDLNITCKNTSTYTGLIGYNNGTVKNIGVINSNVTGCSAVGTGLLVGLNNRTILNSYTTGRAVSSYNALGGLVGNNLGGIDSCYSSATIVDTGGGYWRGGLAGRQRTSSGAYINNSYATGNISGSSYEAGGLVGALESGSIYNSYATGNVQGTTKGGLVGAASGTYLVSTSYWDTNTTGLSTSSGGGTGFTTTQMKRYFSSWNILTNSNNPNNGYPYLAWQIGNTSAVWLTPTAFPFAGGNGSLANPYQIDSWIGLDAIRYNLYANYSLIANLSSSTANYSGLGDSWIGIGSVYTDDTKRFHGDFNGNGKYIKDLRLASPTAVYTASLFGSINGTIENLHLSNFSAIFTGGSAVQRGTAGIFSFDTTNSRIENCSVNGTIRLDFASGTSNSGLLAGYVSGTANNIQTYGYIYGYQRLGGIVGYLAGNLTNAYSNVNISGTGGGTNTIVGGMVATFSTIGTTTSKLQNCISEGSVYASNNVGGLVGSVEASSGGTALINNCSSSVNVVGAGGSTGFTGGLVGTMSSGLGPVLISNSSSSGTVYGAAGYTGGLVGHGYGGTILNSFSSSNVTCANDLCGGLIGSNYQYTGLINNSYSTGSVSAGTYKRGGLVGYTNGNTLTIQNSYSTAFVAGGSTNAGGLIGYYISGAPTVINCFWDINATNQTTSYGGLGTGKTSTEMHTFSTFSNWSIALTNTILNYGLPFLGWQILNNTYTWLMTDMPFINILFPTATTYNQNVSQLNYTYFENVGNDSCWYSTNGGVTNSSAVAYSVGYFNNVISRSQNNTWTLYCNNTAGVTATATTTFTANSLWFNSATAEQSFRATEFVKRNGTNFTLGGQRYTVLGADAYYLVDYATNHTYDDSGNEINGSQSAVKEILNEAQYLNINVIRTWANMQCGGVGANGTTVNWNQSNIGGHHNCFEVGTPGNYSEQMFQAMDWVIYQAGRRDIRLQLVLVNNWNAYGGMNWYVQMANSTNKTGCNGTSPTDACHDQFFTNAEVMQFYKNFLNYTLNRNNTLTGIQYKNDPTIFAWLLANEPRAKTDGTGRTKIVNWTRNITAYIKSIDTNHLVGLGIEGLGYVESWGEGTDMISAHNGTGVDFATFELHPAQWDYFAQRCENQTNGGWITGGITSNQTLLWWVNGSGFSFNNRYAGSYIPAYTPALARHGYQNWVQQNVNWSKNILGMPVLLQEVALPTNISILSNSQKALFFNTAIHNFFANSGDGLMMWNLNHDDYYYSTTTDGIMDDGYSFYLSDDPTLSAQSQGVINAFNFTMYDNSGSSWVNYLSKYKYDFVVNVDKMDDARIVNCSINMAITNATATRSAVTGNTSEIIKTLNNTIQYNFRSGDTSVYWNSTCCSNLSCYTSASTTTSISSFVPAVTLYNPADVLFTNNENTTFNYSVSNGLDISNCQLYIDGNLNQTDTTINMDVSEYFQVNLSATGTHNYSWYVKCTDIVGTSGTSLTRSFLVDKVNPNVTLISPPNNTITNNPNKNFTANISDDNRIRNATLKIYNSSNNLINQTGFSITGLIGDVLSGASTPTYPSLTTVADTSDSGSYIDNSAGSFQNIQVVFYVYAYKTAPNTNRVYSASYAYIDLSDYSGDYFQYQLSWYASSGAEGYVIQATDYNTYNTYWIDVGANLSYTVPNFSMWALGSAPINYQSPYYVSTGNLYNGQEWQVWAKTTYLGEDIYSANYYSITDSDYSGYGWTTNLSWGAVSGANSYIVYSVTNNYWIETSNLYVTDDGSYSGWTSGSPTITPSSPHDTNILNVVVGIVVNLVDGVYNWFYNIFDWSGNEYNSENNTLTVDTILPSIRIITPLNNTNTTNTRLNINYSVSDSFSGISSCWYSDNLGSSNNSLVNCINITGVNWSEGYHNLSIWTNDSAGNINQTSVNFYVDSLAPSIRLLSPANSYSEISSSATINFQFNISEASDIKNCTLYLNNVAYENTSFINKSSINSISISSITSGTYSWFVNCTDLFENKGNSSINSFIITAPIAQTTGGAISYVTPEDLQTDYNNILYVGLSLKFNIGSETHTFYVNKVFNNSATITVSSNPQTITLGVGDERKLSLTNSEYYDLYIKLNSVLLNKANFTIKIINEKIEKEETNKDASSEKIEKNVKNKSKILLYSLILLFLIIVTILIFLIYKIRRKRKHWGFVC